MLAFITIGRLGEGKTLLNSSGGEDLRKLESL